MYHRQLVPPAWKLLLLCTSVLMVDMLVVGLAASQHPRVVFTHNTPSRSPVHASPVVMDGTVLYSTLEPDCAMYLANSSTGAVLWRFAAPRRNTDNPLLSRCGMRTTARVGPFKKLIHTGTDNNTFIAINASSGQAVWTRMETAATCKDGTHYRPCEVYSTALLVSSETAERHMVRIQGSEDGIVRALQADSGAVLWTAELGSEANGSPVLSPSNKSQFFIGTNDNFVYLLEVATGRLMGRVKTCGCVDTEPTVDNSTSTLFYTCFSLDPSQPGNHLGGFVGAVDSHNLTYRWKDNSSTGVPTYHAATGRVYVGYNNGTVAALHAKDGTIAWTNNQIPGQKEFFGAFVFDDKRGRLYGANIGGIVMALDTDTGSVIWSVSLGHPVAHQLGPAVSSDGEILFVGDYGGDFTAFSLTDPQ